MIRKLFRGVAVLALACGAGAFCGAQSVGNFYAAGASYSAGATPSVAGSALYAHRVADADSNVGLYAFTMVDALPNTVKPFTVTTNVSAGLAQKVASVAGADIYLPTSAGISFTGSNTGWAWSTGGAAMVPLKNGYFLMPNVRVVKSSVSNGTGYQPILGVMFGWGK